MGWLPIAMALCVVSAVGALVFVAIYGKRQEERAKAFAVAAASAAERFGARSLLVRGKYPKLLVSVAVPPGGQLEIRAEGSVDRAAESLGFEERVLTGDPSFDERFHVDTDEPEFAQALLASSSARAAVERVFASGFLRLSWKEEGLLAAEWPGFTPKEGSEPALVGDAAQALGALAAAAPSVVTPPSGLTQRAFGRATAGAIAVAGALLYGALIFAEFMPGRPVNGGALFLACLRPAAALEAAALVVLAAALRGKSWFAKGFGSAAFCGLLLFPTLCYYSMLIYNAKFDDSPVASWDLPIVSTYRSSGKHTDYYVDVPDWHGASRSRRLHVGYGLYARARAAGARLRLATRPGRLGHEWIVAMDVAR